MFTVHNLEERDFSSLKISHKKKILPFLNCSFAEIEDQTMEISGTLTWNTIRISLHKKIITCHYKWGRVGVTFLCISRGSKKVTTRFLNLETTRNNIETAVLITRIKHFKVDFCWLTSETHARTHARTHASLKVFLHKNDFSNCPSRQMRLQKNQQFLAFANTLLKETQTSNSKTKCRWVNSFQNYAGCTNI